MKLRISGAAARSYSAKATKDRSAARKPRVEINFSVEEERRLVDYVLILITIDRKARVKARAQRAAKAHKKERELNPSRSVPKVTNNVSLGSFFYPTFN